MIPSVFHHRLWLLNPGKWSTFIFRERKLADQALLVRVSRSAVLLEADKKSLPTPGFDERSCSNCG